MSDASTHVKDHEAKEITNGHKETSTEGSPGKTLGVVSERPILSALKSQSPGFFSTLFGLILLMPMQVLSIVGLYHYKKRELCLSGQPLIDSSPLKPLADEVPEKRKLGEDESTEDDTEEEDMQGVEEDPYKYLRDGVEYDSQEDEDYKPPGEVKDAFDDSAASDEFKEGDTDEDDVNVNPKDILEKKTRGKKLQGDTKESEVIKGSLKGEEKTGPIQLEQQSTHEEKSK